MASATRISAVASIEPRLVKRVEKNRQALKDLVSVRALLEEYGLIPAAKAILADRGFGEYCTRLPLKALGQSARDALLKSYAELGIPD